MSIPESTLLTLAMVVLPWLLGLVVIQGRTSRWKSDATRTWCIIGALAVLPFLTPDSLKPIDTWSPSTFVSAVGCTFSAAFSKAYTAIIYAVVVLLPLLLLPVLMFWAKSTSRVSSAHLGHQLTPEDKQKMRGVDFEQSR